MSGRDARNTIARNLKGTIRSAMRHSFGLEDAAQPFHHLVNLGLRAATAKAEADRAHSYMGRQVHGDQNW